MYVGPKIRQLVHNKLSE